MLDIDSTDIARLSDIDLRALVALLCEAETERRGASRHAVTWGGHQSAPDGGIDVRVECATWPDDAGFIPRGDTGFQVKATPMARTAILDEMTPGGAIRPAILALAARNGAYVIACSQSSTSDTALADRRKAMRDAVAGIPLCESLHTDFYDASRLATWARTLPAVALWVRTKEGLNNSPASRDNSAPVPEAHRCN